MKKNCTGLVYVLRLRNTQSSQSDPSLDLIMFYMMAGF